MTVRPTLATATPPANLPEVVLADVRLHAIKQCECVDHVVHSLAVGRGGWIATANLDHLRRLREPGAFRDAYGSATLVVADGMPLVWACRLQGTPLPERVAGSDLIYSLSAGAAAAGFRVFLLGGDPGTAEAAAARLRAKDAGLVVAGTLCPPVGFERDAEQMAKVQQVLVAADPQLVFVALGSPKQELLIADLRTLLPSAWWIGVGISFSFVAGTVRRAPRWVQLLGLEWLHRLLQEPRRLMSRYLWHGPPFLVRLFAGALARRLRPKSAAAQRPQP